MQAFDERGDGSVQLGQQHHGEIGSSDTAAGRASATDATHTATTTPLLTP
jgi:hypothetical protein